MSQFDFPRINFFGGGIINPPTANNNSFFPLVLFDPVRVRVLMPPRIYLSVKLLRLSSIGLFPLPVHTQVLIDEDHAAYLEISTVNTPEIFKQWVITPLGQSNFDISFHQLYAVIKTAKGNRFLKGLIPAGWNYYGGMDFRFSDVRVKSIAVTGSNQESILYTGKTSKCPPDIAEIMSASVELKNDEGNNTAVMIDVIPGLAFYTQVFCDSFIVFNEEKKILSGKPCKASSRFLNPHRIVNQTGAIAGSGTFYCVIILADIMGEEESLIIKFLRKYQTRNSNIEGVLIRYDLFEVRENQHLDYASNGAHANPARCSVLGSITPWYRNDMKSVTMARQMLPIEAYHNKKRLPPFVYSIDKKRKVFVLDLVGAIPETVAKAGPQKIYHTYGLGELIVKYRMSNDLEVEVGRLHVSRKYLNRDKLIITGGMVEVSYAANSHFTNIDIENGLLHIYGTSKRHKGTNGGDLLLARESEFMIASEQTGIYINQYENPEEGYRSGSDKKEPCKINIYHKGKPFEGVLTMTIKEIKIKSIGNRPSVNTFMQTREFRNNQELQFPSFEPANIIYVLYPANSYTGSKDITVDILNTGFFINLRVLPKHDYGKYLDPQHPEYPVPVTFDLLYKEFLEVFDLIYPSSSIITPFNEEYFKRGWKFIRQRLLPGNWGSHTYMPSSREMSYDLWQLIHKWSESL